MFENQRHVLIADSSLAHDQRMSPIQGPEGRKPKVERRLRKDGSEKTQSKHNGQKTRKVKWFGNLLSPCVETTLIDSELVAFD